MLSFHNMKILDSHKLTEKNYLVWKQKIITIKTVLTIASQHGWQEHHIDVKSAFLNGGLRRISINGATRGVCSERKKTLGL
jgi:hypothetical protein